MGPGTSTLALAWALPAALLLAAWGWIAWMGHLTDRALPHLPDLPPDPVPPRVSVVVPCRNEARGVEAAIRSLLAQELPGLEVVAVDDRSEDATGAILDRLAASDPRLMVLHLTALPPGWLGKNHALQVGALRASGEWLLFTDGDVIFGPGALRRALGHARVNGLGHLAAVPWFVAPGLLERAFVSGFAAFGALAFGAHGLRRPGTRGFVGIGAFNLVRRRDWLRIGGHRRLRREVVDDVKLGLVLRRSGVPQGAVAAGRLVAVRWQHGFVATVGGLLKNAFAACEYRPGAAAGGALGLMALGLGPALLGPLALRAGQGFAAALAGLALLVAAAVQGRAARRLAGGSGLEGLLAPVTFTLLGAVLLASGALAGWRGGVRWRGTLYRLAELRRGVVREGDWPRARAAGWPAAAAPESGRSPDVRSSRPP